MNVFICLFYLFFNFQILRSPKLNTPRFDAALFLFSLYDLGGFYYFAIVDLKWNNRPIVGLIFVLTVYGYSVAINITRYWYPKKAESVHS